MGLCGVLGAAASLWVGLESDHIEEVQVGGAVFNPLIGLSFIATGLYAWWRRPENRFGVLMIAVGFVWLISTLIASDVPGLFALGGLFSALPYAFLLHMLVAFPSGRLSTSWERFLVITAYLDVTVLQLVAVLFLNTADPDFCSGCPANPLLVSDQEVVVGIAFGIQSLIGVFGVGAIAVLLARRWRSASAAAREALAPVLLAGVATTTFLVISLLADVIQVAHVVEPLVNRGEAVRHPPTETVVDIGDSGVQQGVITRLTTALRTTGTPMARYNCILVIGRHSWPRSRGR